MVAHESNAEERLVVGLGLISCAIVTATTAMSTPVFTPDSLYYADVAAQIARGAGPVSFDLHLASPGVPSAPGLWPPGYPYALALLLRLGCTAVRAAALVDAVALLVLAAAVYSLGQLATRNRVASITAAGFAIAHPFVHAVMAYALSEAPFLAATYGSLALLAAGLERNRLRFFAAAGIAAGVSLTLRHAGWFVVAYGGLLIVARLGPRREPARAVGARLLGFALGPLLAAPCAIAANVATYGTAFGLARRAAPDGVRAVVVRLGELRSFATPFTAGVWLAALAVLIVLVVARRPDAEGPPRPSHADARATVLRVVGGWIPFYVVVLLASTARIVTDPYDARLASPVAPALVLVVVVLATRIVRSGARLPIASAVALSFAVMSYVAYGRERVGLRRQHAVSSDLARWASARARPDAVFVASYGWNLRVDSGAIVLVDGYPEMPRLEPESVRTWTRRVGARFRQVYLVTQPSGSLRPGDELRFAEPFVRDGWVPFDEGTFGATRVVGLRAP